MHVYIYIIFVLSVEVEALGVCLDYMQLDSGDIFPTPLADPGAPQYPSPCRGLNELTPPRPNPVPVLSFLPDGGEVPLYARQTLRVAVRNLSAIPASFTTYPGRYWSIAAGGKINIHAVRTYHHL
jgi:hypothetical protein